MQHDDFERRMRALEYYHNLILLPGAWTVVRVDGHSFSRFTADRFEKPFDPRFRAMMLAAARALITDLGGLYAYTESDEISLLLSPAWDLFGREVEKLVSLSAGMASAVFTLAAGTPAHFDSRIWVGVTREQVVDYFRWRHADAARCALNGWAYWTLRKDGLSVSAATQQLKSQTVTYKNELLFQHGINFNDLPAWQRRGTGLAWETYEKPGFNPKTGEAVTATRRRLAEDANLPLGDAYSEYIRAILARVAEQ